MAENWYLVLELEFDPNPVHDQVKINERIEEKAKFWARNFNHFQKGDEYRKFHQMLPVIKEAMNDRRQRERMIEEACKVVYEPIDKLLKTIGRKGSVTEDELQKIAQRQKIDLAIVEKRCAALGIKKERPKTINFKEIYAKHYDTKPQNVAAFDNMLPMLRSFGTDNLYDFLGVDSSLSCDDLRPKVNTRRKDFNKHDSTSDTGSKLCTQCDLAFKDSSSKNIYDQYLEYTRKKVVLNEVKNIAEISGELPASASDIYIEKLTKILKNRKIATDVLVAFCEVKKILYHIASASSSEDLKICRCGHTNNVSDGRTLCGDCGAELTIKCPKCDSVNNANIKVCKCGFKLDNIDTALALCNLAEHAINNALDFSAAQINLAEAERLWSGNKKVRDLTALLKERKAQTGVVIDAMRKAVDEKRFLEAEKRYKEVRAKFPGFSDSNLENDIQIAITAAKQYLTQAQASKDEGAIIEFCSKAHDACVDYPGIKELLPHPKAPTDFCILADGNARSNLLSWSKSVSTGSVSYTIIRKVKLAPVSIDDGIVLGKTSACHFCDSKIKPAESYFYAVFAERVGVYSNILASSTPTYNLFEISGVTITAGDSLLQLEWPPHPKNATVEIFRNSNHEKEKHSTVTSNSHLDSGLQNDTTYYYTIKLAYNVNGQKQLTNGVLYTGIPSIPAKPIESLKIKPGDGDLFNASWHNPDDVEVDLYCSNEKPAYRFGESVSQATLETSMRRLALNRNSKTAASFQYKGEDLLYVVATVIKAGTVVFGSVARASKDETVKINRIAVVNEKINIYINAPSGATGFVVLYCFDKYPEDITDVKAIRKDIPLKQYQHHSALVIDAIEPRNYYFSVFAEFTRDGEKDFSIGTDYLFSNVTKETITYSISATTKLFGDSFVLLKFEAENNSFILPDIEIMSAIDNTPMFKVSAKLFHEIKSQPVNGSLQIKVPLSKGIAKDTYIKAFLKDEILASTYQLKLKLKSNYKIT